MQKASKDGTGDLKTAAGESVERGEEEEEEEGGVKRKDSKEGTESLSGNSFGHSERKMKGCPLGDWLFAYY